MADERRSPGLKAGEREMLRGYLEYHRATLALKCGGLDDEQWRRTAVPSSTLSLLGLVRHLAEVERAWFRRTVNGEDVPLVWSEDFDFQAAYDARGSTRAEAFDAWRAEVEHSRRIEGEADSLDLVVFAPRLGEEVSLRLVMLHVLLEYARHNGHADLLREGVDGTTGV
ncbi:DinB family protein [Streptomyces sp. XM4193]|uniref:DinB family protein n=1 Tax=Streptomyces sp. XM4193 TaxID=2929782 RepID=UPI001FF7F031|nr:DinB family protein [Streptomyces sp. XM4193]MCK1795569.1 DinB family protein [Streptomyces sp. XM4193]